MSSLCPAPSLGNPSPSLPQRLYVLVRDLPPAIQRALESLTYHRRDISLESAETADVGSGGGDGYRCFACMVDLSSGQHETTWGSWGGANMFSPDNAVDLDTTPKPLPVGYVLIKGSQGGVSRATYATLMVHPDTMAPLLPDMRGPALSPEEHRALNIIGGIKGGHHRRDEWQRRGLPGEYGSSHPLIVSLAEKGLVKVNKAGAVSITTAGRNAR